MGLDATIRKRPESATTDVKYWRKNWVLQNWIDTNNCDVKLIDLQLMYDLLEFIKDQEQTNTAEGSEGWTPEHWNDFEEDIKDVIQDMESNETYEYTYDAWW